MQNSRDESGLTQNPVVLFKNELVLETLHLVLLKSTITLPLKVGCLFEEKTVVTSDLKSVTEITVKMSVL